MGGGGGNGGSSGNGGGDGNLINGQVLLDGFGFLEGELIGNAPLVFPGESEVFMLLELTAQFGGAFGPIGAVIAIIAEIITMILELVDYLVSLFEGVPRTQKSLIVARRFGTGQNIVSHLVSAQLYQLINDEGIVLSSSNPADQAKFTAIRKQAELMLVSLGATQSAAKTAVNNVFDNTTGPDEQLPDMLHKPMPAGWVLVGPQQIQADYIAHYNKLVGQGLKPPRAAKLTWKWIYQHEPQQRLVKITLRPQPGSNPCQPGLTFNPQTGLCEPTLPIIHTCPPGYQWDDTQQKCVVIPTNPQQCPVGQVWDPTTQTCVPDTTYPQPCQPSSDGTGDTLTDGLGCVSQNLLVLQRQIADLQQAITGTGGQPLDPVTCTQLGNYVSTINVSLQAINSAIAAAAGGGTTVDLTTVVNELVAIAGALASYPPVWDAIAAAVTTQLAAIAANVGKGGATDVSGIVDQLAKLFTTIDIPPAIVQTLVEENYLSPDVLKTMGQGDFGSVILSALASLAYTVAKNLLSWFGISIAGGKLTVANPSQTIANDLSTIFGDILTVGDSSLEPTVKALVAKVRATLLPTRNVTLGDVGADPDQAITAATSAAFAAAGAAWLIAFAGIDEGEPLAHLAELLAGAVGFEELRDVQIGPLVRNGIGKAAEMQAKAIFGQELPGTTALFGLEAMGLLTAARARQLATLNGTPPELQPALETAAFRGLNPRQMLRLIETNLFSDADIADELTFAAMRPVSQHRMLLAAPYLASASERSQLRATIESAGTAGLLDDQSLVQALDAAESNTDRDSLSLSKVHLQQLMANAAALEQEYSALFKGGLLADETFRVNLAAIGLQQWKIDQVAAKAEVAANVTLQKKTLAAEAALERSTENKARAVAVKAFTAGTIDAAGLLAALLLTGLTDAQAAFWVSQAVLQKGGGLRWLYGLQLSPTAAILLRERVGALTDQRKRLQITDPQFVSALQALGIGDRYVNALRAAADAMITPKTSAVVIPVQTN